MAKPLPSSKELWCLFDYLPSGDLVWKPRGSQSFDTKHAGNVVSPNLTPKGYRKVNVCGRYVMAHRVIWKMHHDTDPEVVDHVNGVRDDNRICNLRGATRDENARNNRRNLSGTGYKGVIRATKTDRWEARIKVSGRQSHIGTFDTAEDAARAYDAAAVRLHGEFSVTNKGLGLI